MLGETEGDPWGHSRVGGGGGATMSASVCLCLSAWVYLLSTCPPACYVYVLIWTDTFLHLYLWDPLSESFVRALTATLSCGYARCPTQVLRAPPTADRSRGAGAERTDTARPSGGAAKCSLSLSSCLPSCGPRHLPPALPACA